MVTIEREFTIGPQEPDIQAAQNVHFTQREIDVLRLKAFGMSRKEIAESLGISIHTVSIHIGNTKVRTGSYCTLETVLIAVDLGLIDKDELAERFDFGRYSLLSQREKEILLATSNSPGDCHKEAAHKEEIAMSTYKNTMERIYSKLNVKGIGQAILFRRLMPRSLIPK